MPPQSPTARDPAFTLQEIVRRLGGEVAGDASVTVNGVAAIDEAGPGEITFLANPRYRSRLAATRAGAVILGPRDRDATAIARIVADNPYAYYARTVALFNPPRVVVPGTHPTACVDPGARVAASAEIGPFAVIAAGARVGERACIGAGSVVGEGASIGDDTILYPRVTVYHACVVGARCILHSGAVIGADGFGMAPDAGRWVKIPQVGRAVLGDDVEVGANTTIDRGALGDTVVEDGVKIDNQVQVAHNCRIGAHTVIAGCVGISGSVVIGRHCLIGGGAGIVGHITLCDGVTVSGMTFITKSITRPGVYSSGMPMMPHADWLRNAAQLRRLDETARLARGKSAPGEEREDDDD
ncbi:MAG TPA: UDP-3-O-(3-hydroxymyristoyl)glucosamine N-acyltransferase [Usitatibacteraceae bacterium]|nr:UDP-3-O-(3-hydroxymyristoyl)glucosamine N-acyltransferase [Usitatibacteraceae bacterium]